MSKGLLDFTVVETIEGNNKYYRNVPSTWLKLENKQYVLYWPTGDDAKDDRIRSNPHSKPSATWMKCVCNALESTFGQFHEGEEEAKYLSTLTNSEDGVALFRCLNKRTAGSKKEIASTSNNNMSLWSMPQPKSLAPPNKRTEEVSPPRKRKNLELTQQNSAIPSSIPLSLDTALQQQKKQQVQQQMQPQMQQVIVTSTPLQSQTTQQQQYVNTAGTSLILQPGMHNHQGQVTSLPGLNSTTKIMTPLNSQNETDNADLSFELPFTTDKDFTVDNGGDVYEEQVVKETHDNCCTVCVQNSMNMQAMMQQFMNVIQEVSVKLDIVLKHPGKNIAESLKASEQIGQVCSFPVRNMEQLNKLEEKLGQDEGFKQAVVIIIIIYVKDFCNTFIIFF